MIRMRRLRRSTWRLLRETSQEWQKDKASVLAAALAYYTIFSITPLLVFVIAIAGFFFGQSTVQSEILVQIQEFIGQDGASLVKTTLENAKINGSQDSLTASIISIGLLFIGATGVFVQLQDALNTIWSVQSQPSQGWLAFLQTRLLSFSMVIGIGFLLLVSLVMSTVLGAINHFAEGKFHDIGLYLWHGANFIFSYGITTLLFAMIFKFLPDVKIYWRDVWIGSVATTLLFSMGESLLGLYLRHGGVSSSYGAAGSLVIMIAWIYYSAQILFLGAEFTQVYARNFGVKIQSKQSLAK